MVKKNKNSYLRSKHKRAFDEVKRTPAVEIWKLQVVEKRFDHDEKNIRRKEVEQC